MLQPQLGVWPNCGVVREWWGGGRQSSLEKNFFSAFAKTLAKNERKDKLFLKYFIFKTAKLPVFDWMFFRDFDS